MTQIWDISPPVSEATAAFPGDTPYTQRWTATLTDDCPVNVSAIDLSPHVGAHADAPLHYDNDGAAIGELDLTPYLGTCRVIHAVDARPLIEWDHIAHAVDDLPPRVLVRTCQQAPTGWDPDFAAFAPDTIARLADAGVLLVGLDTASVDPSTSKSLDAHQVLRHRDVRVLENLVLDDVDEGDYELIALPLKLVTADASPVRAILRRM